MKLVWLVNLTILCIGTITEGASRPEFVNIGAIFTFNTINGKVARIAMKAAEEDVNSDPSILGGCKLNVSMHDSNFSGFLSIIGALQYMETDTVAIIGPQSSVMAHVISHLANELQVPLLSFTALDPTLSPLQYPYFIQTAPNDFFQMTAIAEMVSYFRWREVVTIYTEDDQSRNGITILGDKLVERRCKISYKAALPPDPTATRSDVIDQLMKVQMIASRVIVLNTFSRTGLLVFDVAKRLGMMESGYIWIATTWLSTVLDSNSPVPSNISNTIQGVLTLRPHTPDSKRKQAFMSRWNQLSNGSIGLNPYGLYAYDTVWMIARALKLLLDQGGTVSFSEASSLSTIGGGAMNLSALSIFDGGKKMLQNILLTNMSGLTGTIQFDPDRSLLHPAFEIINVIGHGYQQIGYWSNYSGLSTVPPETLYAKPPNRSSSNQHLSSVVWPGGATKKPRGWVFPYNGRELKIGVPDRASFKQFVSKVKGTDEIKGYCIDVFNAAIKMLPYEVPYKFILFGDGQKNPSYNELVNLVSSNVFDAAVGDVAIVTNRTRIVDFTQPYIDSGLVVVAPVRKSNSSPWAFLQPFSPWMWAVTACFFLIVGAVVWILEHRINDDFRGPPRKQIATILWWVTSHMYTNSHTQTCLYRHNRFVIQHIHMIPQTCGTPFNLVLSHLLSFITCRFSFSTMFFSHRENTVSSLGRLVLVIWLFVVLIINSSYTASLTSILTVQQLSSPIQGIDTLITSTQPIGYQVGSFAENYLIEELNIPKSRLIPLGSPEEYAHALKEGTVSAVVDEEPYVELFLSNHCQFSIRGAEFTRSGWGFAFPRDSPLAIDMSTAMLALAENGQLQKIHDKWLSKNSCSSESVVLEHEQLHLSSFWGLFLICGILCLLALLAHSCCIFRQFSQRFPQDYNSRSGGSSRTSRLHSFLSFADEKDVELRKKRKEREMIPNGHESETFQEMEA